MSVFKPITTIPKRRRSSSYTACIYPEWNPIIEKFRDNYMPTLKTSDAVSHIHYLGILAVEKMILNGQGNQIVIEDFRKPQSKYACHFRKCDMVDRKFREVSQAIPLKRYALANSIFIRTFLYYGLEEISKMDFMKDQS